MKIAVDARPLIGNRTGVGNYLFNILSEWEKMEIKDTVYLYSNTSYHFPWKSSRWVMRIGNLSKEVLNPLSKAPSLFAQQILPMTYYGLSAIKDGADIFWAPYPRSPFFLPIKTAVTVHDFVYKKYPQTMADDSLRAYNFFADRSIKKASVLFSVSGSTTNDLRKYFTDCDNIVLSSNASSKVLDPSFCIQSARTDLFKKYDLASPFILTVLTLEPRKNLEGLLQAYKIFLNETSALHKLVVVGMSGWKTSKIFAMVKELDLEDRVVFPGYVPDEDLALFYSCAEFFVYPSLYEGFGIPPLEAMGYGCPVIVSDRPAMSEVAGGSALLVDPDDHRDIAHKMGILFTDKQMVQSLKAKGLERVRAYSWRAAAEAVYVALLDAVNGREKNSKR